MLEILREPVVSEGERAIIQLQMARVAYQEWAICGGIEPDWDALPMSEKERWVRYVRKAFRAMLSLVGHLIEGQSEDA
jgi:hypothetical protein